MSGRPHIKGLLLDISGNLHIGSKPTPNAVEALNRLRASRIPFRLCSNLSKESIADLIGRLQMIGFTVGEPKSDGKEIWTSVGDPYVLMSKSAREEVLAESQGQSQSTPGTERSSDSGYDSVVVGLSPGHFDYDHLNTAFRILVGEEGDRRPEPHRKPPLIATHKAKYIQKEDPPGLSLGPGPFVTALEFATARSAHVVGKPTKEFFEMVVRDFTQAELEEGDDAATLEGKIAIVGDDIEADLGGGALDLGLWRVLVKTGKYRPGDENRPGTAPPDQVCDCFADFVDDLLRAQGLPLSDSNPSDATRSSLN
ncbi:haloacid dehalogenase-like hydrolase domain-containing protein 2 [Coprinopsis marcescibilis]|uniref:Haloacid dehalogenase-like hydrolase domain-containing protein 2 n=1 Tax=Coprinopsis marcescibilis TaxID=230819 RepID=A0A5C3KQN7_COPMA|nr:haloacid dehalogenase-like hydrolase domain-containing protein 2 [Coprinopsis marcescibilis]